MNKFTIQLFAAFIISIPNFIIGFSLSWPSYTLLQLQSEESPLGSKISSTDANLIGSFPVIGCFITNILAGYITDTIGRKGSEILAGLCLTVSLLTIATAPGVTLLIIGRFLTGLGYGIHSVVSLLYIAELCEVSVRGTLGSVTVFAFCSGSLVSFIMGWLCSYNVINYFIMSLSVVFLLFMSWLKETPIYLLAKGQEQEALKSLLFFRGLSSKAIPQNITQEFSQLKSQRNRTPDPETSNIKSENEKLTGNPEENQTMEKDMGVWKILQTSKSARAALVTISMNMMLTALMGSSAVQTYAGQFFTAAVPDVSPHLCSIALAVIVAAGSLVSMVISDMVGRRILMISATGVSSVLLMLLASLLRWSWAPRWLVPVVLLAFSFVFQLGPGCVPLVQLSECYRPQVKDVSVTISTCLLSVTYFVLLLLFRPCVEVIGLDGTFLVFSMFGCLATVTSGLVMKETRGVPLNDITEMFEKGYFCRYPNKR